ncbi:MAG: hypothetical protein LBL86_11850 [Coriobacteriales bacterium]|jgi:hypothetical protein|nr:hypothetical protein [Coriobacteriales bacterium]
MEDRKRRKARRTALTAGLAVLLLAAAAAAFLFFAPAPPRGTAPLEAPPASAAPSETSPSGPDDGVSPGAEDKNQDDAGDVAVSDAALSPPPDPPAAEGEVRAEAGEGLADPDAPPPSLLDLPGVHPASGEFALGSVPEGKELDLSGNADGYAAIITAIRSADPDFDPEGYRVAEHVSHQDENGVPDHGDVRVTLYIGDIKTSSSCYVNVDGSDIQFVSTTRLYHPTAAEMEQARQQRADFEANPASREAIERTKASMWPDGTGTTQLEYSEDYGYVFKTGRLYLTITDDRRQGGVIVAKQERIDCLEVLGR